jgi:lambda family phage portal protein
VYEAGSFTRRNLGWHAPTVSPNRELLGSLATLRDRSRHAARNDGYASGVLDKLVYNVVGTGIKPLSKADDPAFRKLAQDLWLRWTDESDAAGLLDWYGQQSQSVRCWLEAGEVFVRLRSRLPEDGLVVPLQAEVLEPEMCPHGWNTPLAGAPAGSRVRAGIEFDRIGRRTAYYFFASRPGDIQDWDASDLRRVPADQVLHVYKPKRAGQLRGEPHLTRALIRLRELDKFDDATLIRQQLSNMFVAFLKQPLSANPTVQPITGLDTTLYQDQRPVLGLEPGIFQTLDPGEEVQFSNPPDLMQGYADFTRQQLMAVSAATGVPYEVLTGDMSKVNDRTVRVILHEFRRQIEAEQHQTVAHQLCRPVWWAWMDRAYLSGALPIPGGYLKDPCPWGRVEWMPQGWPYIHPVQDVQAAKDAIRSGFTTRSAIVSEQGEDAQAIDEQNAADNARADELKLKYDSDGRAATGGGPRGPRERTGATRAIQGRGPSMKQWFKFSSRAEDPTVAEVQVTDFIGDWIDDFFGFGVTAKSFVDQLSALPAAVKTIKVHINSPGGDVFGAINIANALRDQRMSKGRKVETYVDGLAASAATLVAMAGDPVRIADNGLFMVHNPWSMAVGNAAEMRKNADVLDEVRNTLVATYQWHAELSDEELIALMDAETWMTAQEAVDKGFADEVIEGLQAAASIDPRSAARLGIKVPAEYEARVNAWTAVAVAVEPTPAPAALAPAPAVVPAPEAVAPAAVISLCKDAGLDLEFTAALVAKADNWDAVNAAVAAERTRRQAEDARRDEITAMCQKFTGGALAPEMIQGGMSAESARLLVAKVTALLDKVEVDASIAPDGGTRPRATINPRDVYDARRKRAG